MTKNIRKNTRRKWSINYVCQGWQERCNMLIQQPGRNRVQLTRLCRSLFYDGQKLILSDRSKFWHTFLIPESNMKVMVRIRRVQDVVRCSRGSCIWLNAVLFVCLFVFRFRRFFPLEPRWVGIRTQGVIKVFILYAEGETHLQIQG